MNARTFIVERHKEIIDHHDKFRKIQKINKEKHENVKNSLDEKQRKFKEVKATTQSNFDLIRNKQQ